MNDKLEKDLEGSGPGMVDVIYWPLPGGQSRRILWKINLQNEMNTKQDTNTGDSATADSL